jgi:hypothetical protein
MRQPPLLSLIVPTRHGTDRLARLMRSLAATAADPAALEVVLVVDADDSASRAFRFPSLAVQQVVVPPGLSMGSLNMAGYQAASGDYLMLLNDDVIARTRRWDRHVLACLRGYPDGIVLVHVNDLLFGQILCTFPLVSRRYCELAGGICPREYQRYRIDDHIEDVFSLLWVLGERRSVYLADVVFEHFKFAEQSGERRYLLDENVLAQDAPRFEALARERKELALRLKAMIAGPAGPARMQRWRTRLEAITDSFALRVPERHHVESSARKLHRRLAGRLRRMWRHVFNVPILPACWKCAATSTAG